MTKMARLLLAGCCLMPAACATPGGGPLGIVAFDPNQHVSGAEPLLGKRGSECDATTLLTAFAPGTAVQSSANKTDWCDSLRNAMAWALKAHPGSPGVGGYSYTKAARNEVVGMLMADRTASATATLSSSSNITTMSGRAWGSWVTRRPRSRRSRPVAPHKPSRQARPSRRMPAARSPRGISTTRQSRSSSRPIRLRELAFASRSIRE